MQYPAPPFPQKGQALLELIAACALIFVTLVGCGRLFATEWKRARCAYMAFEAAHAALIDRHAGSSARFGVKIREDAQSVESEVVCGSLREKVRLQRLEVEP